MSVLLDRDQTAEIPATELTADKKETTTPASHFFKVVWRWHFYAGLFVVPFMLMLAVTGIIYLFKPQYEAWAYQEMMFVTPAGQPLPYTEQLAQLQTEYPTAAVTAFIPQPAADRSTQFSVSTEAGQNLAVFVNPYTGRVLGNYDKDNNLQAYALKLHGELMVGSTGDYLIELAVSWGLVLIVTGLYLWWPRKQFTPWGILLPRLRTTNKRVFWRDLHAVPGFWGAFLLLFMILTGLPWTGFWGSQFTGVMNSFPAEMWNEVPESTPLTGSLNLDSEKIVPWAAEQIPLPQSNTDHANHTAGGEVGLTAGAVTINTIAQIAQERGVVPGHTISFPADEKGVYTVSVFPPNPADEATLHIDQYSGEVLADVRWAQYGVVPKAVELGIALHEGKYFGLANQLLMLAACLLIILLCVSGVVMWWRRRPAGVLGAPTVPANFPLWKGAAGIAVVMGLMFPLMGLSLVVIVALDFLLISRVPMLKRVTG